jgi:hypothetical protein
MLLLHVIEDLRSVLNSEPSCVSYEIAIACYKNEVGGEISVQSVGSFNWDDDEFFFNPKGTASAYKLEERLLTTKGLLSELESTPTIHTHSAYVREKVKFLPDDSVASLNSPIWGTGIHHVAKLVYFYFGKSKPAT